jgi:hypothetical protein
LPFSMTGHGPITNIVWPRRRPPNGKPVRGTRRAAIGQKRTFESAL